MKKRIVLDIDIDTDQEGITGILPRDIVGNTVPIKIRSDVYSQKFLKGHPAPDMTSVISHEIGHALGVVLGLPKHKALKASYDKAREVTGGLPPFFLPESLVNAVMAKVQTARYESENEAWDIAERVVFNSDRDYAMSLYKRDMDEALEAK